MLLTVIFAAVSAYYVYEAVQVALNPVTTVELGRGNFTALNAYGNIISETYQMNEFRISAYRYVIIYPYFVIDTRLGGRISAFGPVNTDVILDGVTKATIVYPAVGYNPSSGSVVTVLPRNVSIVSGLPRNVSIATGVGLVTRTYCVAANNCLIPNAEVFVRADLVR